ncbi:hypothetical protein CORMATOL_00336 [Corynebacterium matruchotii ATCC 33806]|uniref:Uncharacterized protein n=1 Tax=Corynebacterium matruchotii ATCC 33806 TaxID=566549 RepID=C0E036_9CORY|nr:hypothetical protein CORMATOL_00336 [Corynebacterium matruchotii ATCC 33806]
MAAIVRRAPAKILDDAGWCVCQVVSLSTADRSGPCSTCGLARLWKTWVIIIFMKHVG